MTYPFFPIPPSPSYPGGGSPFSPSEGSDGGEGGAGESESESESSESGATEGDGGLGPSSETDSVVSESLGTGSGSPGTGGAAGEGYFEGGAPAVKQYTQTFVIRNNGGGNARIRSISFNTPTGIQHIADLTNLGSAAAFSEPLFTTSTVVSTGSSVTFTVGYNYEFGGNGTRTGSIVVRGNNGIELRSNITLVVGQTGSTAGGSSITSGSGTGGGGSGGGYIPPAVGAGAGTSLSPLEDDFTQEQLFFYDIS